LKELSKFIFFSVKRQSEDEVILQRKLKKRAENKKRGRGAYSFFFCNQQKKLNPKESEAKLKKSMQTPTKKSG